MSLFSGKIIMVSGKANINYFPCLWTEAYPTVCLFKLSFSPSIRTFHVVQIKIFVSHLNQSCFLFSDPVCHSRSSTVGRACTLFLLTPSSSCLASSGSLRIFLRCQDGQVQLSWCSVVIITPHSGGDP